jgi:hypothetical protein
LSSIFACGIIKIEGPQKIEERLWLNALDRRIFLEAVRSNWLSEGIHTLQEISCSLGVNIFVDKRLFHIIKGDEGEK